MESKVGFVILASRRSVIQLVPRWCISVERHIGVVRFAVNDRTDGKGRPSLQETMVRTHQRLAKKKGRRRNKLDLLFQSVDSELPKYAAVDAGTLVLLTRSGSN